MKQTIENLTKAFIGESQARNRYTFYASTAKKEGYEQIAEVFEMTAMNENEHAEWLMKMINQLKSLLDANSKAITTYSNPAVIEYIQQNKGHPEIFNEIHVDATAPTIWGTTVDNLKAAIAGETYEFTTMYPEFAKAARAEGYKDIAGRLESIAKAETHHGQRYTKLLKELEAGTVFKKSEPVWWFCRKCGYMHFGTEPPAKCPVCDHERSYYQVMSENY